MTSGRANILKRTETSSNPFDVNFALSLTSVTLSVRLPCGLHRGHRGQLLIRNSVANTQKYPSIKNIYIMKAWDDEGFR